MAGSDEGTKFILIGGYSQSGKNTFATSLQGKNDIAWKLMSREGATASPGGVESTGAFSAPFFETSFAFSLKKTVCERLSIPLDRVDDLKDIPLSFDQLLVQQPHWHCCTSRTAAGTRASDVHLSFSVSDPPPFATLRDVLIDEAAFQRQRDPEFYAFAALNVILAQHPEPSACLITDWRYPNEIAFFERFFGKESVFSIRVIRDGYRVSSSPSEHALDTYSPDFIAVPYETRDIEDGVCDEVYFNWELYTYASVVNRQLKDAAKGARGQTRGHHDEGVDAGEPISVPGVADD